MISRALTAVSDLARKVAAEPESLEAGLREAARSLHRELGLESLTIEAEVGGEEIQVSAGNAKGEPLELPILRGGLTVGRMLLSPRETPDGARDALAAVADVLSLAISNAESHSVAARRSAQTSIIQLASDALSRTLDEAQIYQTVLTLALELLDSEAGAVFIDGAPVSSVGFAEIPETLASLKRLEHPGQKGWRGRVREGYAQGVPLGRSESSLFLFRGGRAYVDSDVGSLRLVARQLSHARERSGLYDTLEQRDLEAIQALSAALESRDGTTGGHIDRTQYLAEAVALDLGLGAEESRAARYAAVLHDIGKIGVPDGILNKPGALSEEEWEVMRRHPAIGANIQSGITGFERTSEVVLSHHERFDGAGYPRRLAGEDVPVEARIISVVDTYDAMTNDRPYRAAMSHEAAVTELRKNAGTQFDPGVIESFERVIGKDVLVPGQRTPDTEIPAGEEDKR
jgi:HD-GYP domain-containing protein (c-di-GMP phosphodiesterase class II)